MSQWRTQQAARTATWARVHQAHGPSRIETSMTAPEGWLWCACPCGAKHLTTADAYREATSQAGPASVRE